MLAKDRLEWRPDLFKALQKAFIRGGNGSTMSSTTTLTKMEMKPRLAWTAHTDSKIFWSFHDR
ncbi:hypothetical protein ANCCAN_08923 [Ancylostoma caninum]|uniref:Uncharacterized protein n=1 Tax=Ancylostoma caninum TaxID=29170 RepID=A0A368GN55_ANCCA|nr:hypothetical protein ANCCAN_08923 [Ancylostoma caninum]